MKCAPISYSEANAKALSSDHLLPNLGKHGIRGGFIAVVGQAIGMVVQLANVAIMSRLLGPEDFGLIAMAAAITAFVGIFTDLGLSTATIQKKEIDQDTVSALFLINVLLGFVVMMLAWGIAPLAGWGFDDERVSAVILVSSLALPIAASSAQHSAILTRRMEWLTLKCIPITAQILGSLIAVLVAWHTSLGYWSIVAGNLTSVLVSCALFWSASSWRPSLVKDWTRVYGSLTFGLWLTGFRFLSFFHGRFDSVLIGWVWGPTQLGYYDRAYAIFILPATSLSMPIGSVMIPALSRVQDKPDRWRRILLKGISAVSLLSAPLSVTIILYSENIIIILFGSKWTYSIDILYAFGFGVFWQSLYQSANWIFPSLGRSKQLFIGGIPATIFLILAFLLGLPHGGLGVATSYALAMSLLTPIWLWWASRGTPVSLLDILASALPYACLAAIVASFIHFLVHENIHWFLSMTMFWFAYSSVALAFVFRGGNSGITFRHWLR